MKYILTPLIFIFLFVGSSYAQTGHVVQGSLVDTAKQSLPGSTVKIKTDLGDSTTVATDIDGKFSFSGIKGTKITLYLSSFGYQAIIKHFSFASADAKPLIIPPIILKSESKQLKEVVIVGVNPIKFKEDTVEYKIAAYPVRDNAPVEDVLKKIPGVDVDANGNVSAQGKNVTKIRINGKDFMGNDVQSATKNLPADILESVQVIDDYGDQANLTGVKTGEPNKILNFTIKADKNYGYSLQATAGGGRDLLPKDPGVTNDNRYIGSVNLFDFKGDRQLTVLGNLNNTNVNTFNFGGGPGGGGGGGGGRGNAARGNNQASSSLASVANGITSAHAIGTNYRDQWGKYISVYGSYSFSDNTTLTNSTNLQNNNNATPTSSSSISHQQDNPVNHRFTFNMEYKPDTVNYLKLTPTFSYGSTNSNGMELDTFKVNNVLNRVYTINSISNSQAPTLGMIALFNHRFHKAGRNLSVFGNVTSTSTTSFDNPIYNYTAGAPNAPINQVINTDNHTTTYGGIVSYLEPIGAVSYLEFNYAYNHSYTSNDKETDTLSTSISSPPNTFNNYALLSNNYNFTFVTHKVGVNFRVIEKNYNYTLGLGVQPSTLDGHSITSNTYTHVNQFNFVPTARYIYNFSRNESFSANYNGSSSQPSFNQLQPVIDFSNASYPVQGNPDLKPQFANNFSVRYNSFGIITGNIMFINASFSQINNYAAINTVTFPGKFTSAAIAQNPLFPKLVNTNLTQYQNSDGYYSAMGQFFFAKPWEDRKYTLSFNGAVAYTNNVAYSTSVDSNGIYSPKLKNLAKNLTFSPALRFRVDIINVIDAQIGGTYAINRTHNSISNSVFDANANTQTATLALTGKNYLFTDWTFSYDYTKQLNYGYDKALNVTNPNILSLYLERRFLKNNVATIRLAAFDLFNQNTGFSTVSNGSTITETNTNRLGRYYMLTFALRLQKFAGRAPAQPDSDYKRGDGGGRGGRQGGGGSRQGGGGGGFGGGGGGNGGGGFGGPQ